MPDSKTLYDLFKETLEVARKFNERGVKYVLIGGLALYLQGLPRYTEDMDFMLEASVDNLNRAKEALQEVYQDPELETISPKDLDYAVIRYVSPSGSRIDLLFRLGEVADYETLKSYIEEKEVEGTLLKILNKEGLYFLKKDTIRPIDRQDALWLREALRKEGKDVEKD